MDKKHIGGQPSPDDTSKIGSKPGLLHTAAEKIFAAFGLMLLLTIPLFIIGKDHVAGDRFLGVQICEPDRFKLNEITCFLKTQSSFLFYIKRAE